MALSFLHTIGVRHDRILNAAKWERANLLTMSANRESNITVRFSQNRSFSFGTVPFILLLVPDCLFGIRVVFSGSS